MERKLDIDAIGEYEIVGRTLATTISPGTEFAAYIGLQSLRPCAAYPRLIGYCNVAQVVKVGKGVSGIKVGDIISTHQSHCSSFICSMWDVLFVLAPGDSPEIFSSMYIWHLGYYPYTLAPLSEGCNIGIVGLGAIGLTSLMYADYMGYSVTGITRRASKLELNNYFNYGNIINSQDCNSLSGVYDAVIVTSNDWGDWQLALRCAKINGKIFVVGFPGRGQEKCSFNPLDPQFFYDKQLSIFSCGAPSIIYDRGYGFSNDVLVENYNRLALMLRDVRFQPNINRVLSKKFHWRDLEIVYKNIEARDDNFVTGVLLWE